MPNNRIESSSAITKIDFKHLRPSDQVEQVLGAVANYLFSVEERIKRSGVTFFVGNLARYSAMHELNFQISKITRQMAGKVFLGIGIMDDVSSRQSMEQGLDGMARFIEKISFMAQMSPYTPARDKLLQYKELIEDEQLKLADKSANAVLDRYKGLRKQLLESHSDPQKIVEKYFEENQSVERPPAYLSFIVDFLRTMQAWDNLSKYDSTAARSAYLGAHLKRHQMMDAIYRTAIGGFEQQLVNSIVDYKKSGPEFIDDDEMEN